MLLQNITTRYTKMLTEGGKEKDIINCRETIQARITEIELRKRSETVENPSLVKRSLTAEVSFFTMSPIF